MVRNRFSGEIACRLRARDGRAEYAGHAVGFRFKTRSDVAGAVYRVDGGPPRAWRDDRAALIILGAPLDFGGMDNPSGGVVWLPLSVLADANAVMIQPRPDRGARTFHFRGLKGLHQLGLEQGCAPDIRFVR